jgi:hypothetical protein
MWSAGTLKGVGSFDTVHVKMQVFMVLFSERNTLPTWIPAARCARKVRSYPEMAVMC